MKILGEMRTEAVLESVPLVKTFVAEKVVEHGLTGERASQISMAAEEAVRNIVQHAYAGHPGEIAITCKSDNAGRLVITTTDYADAFNIFLATDPLMSDSYRSSTGERPSMAVMKRFIKNIEYKRYENMNILVFTIGSERT